MQKRRASQFAFWEIIYDSLDKSTCLCIITGAHTIGFAQCFTFKQRLFNFDGNGNPDPALDASFRQSLQIMCPNQNNSDTRLVGLDANTANKFDNSYYRNLVNNSGLLQSDQDLMTDNRTSSMVQNYSKYPYLFSKDFAASMRQMASIGVLTGQNGEIRKNCRVVNQKQQRLQNKCVN